MPTQGPQMHWKITKSSFLVQSIFVITFCCSVLCSENGGIASSSSLKSILHEKASILDDGFSTSGAQPPNHRSENKPVESQTSNKRQNHIDSKSSDRHGRQYDGSLGTSGSGSFAAVSGEGAYLAQMPISSSMSSNSASSGYTADQANGYSDIMGMAARGYPQPGQMGSAFQHSSSLGPAAGSFGSPLSSISPMLHSSPFGLSGSAAGLSSSSMFPLMSKGFDVAEIVCTAIAVAIGAVIVGAPFILIYLFVMNQTNGGGGPTSGPSGAISLTGPTSSTTISGRKKRHASLSETLFKQISPLINNEQVLSSFKMLMNSIAKYQV